MRRRKVKGMKEDRKYDIKAKYSNKHQEKKYTIITTASSLAKKTKIPMGTSRAYTNGGS